MLACGLGVLCASDAGASGVLAWYGTAAAVVTLAVALAVGAPAGVQASLVPLAAVLLLRHDERLLLAPLYGACLLVVGELGQRSIELRGQGWIGPGVIASRLLPALVVGALGACAAVLAAIAGDARPCALGHLHGGRSRRAGRGSGVDHLARARRSQARRAALRPRRRSAG